VDARREDAIAFPLGGRRSGLVCTERGSQPVDKALLTGNPLTIGSVQLTLDGDVAILRLNRPDASNAVTAELLSSLLRALAYPGLSDARALVVTGEGKNFCGGADLRGIRQAFEGDVDAVLGSMVRDLHDVIAQLRQLPMPVIAAVEGAAVGAGMGIALAADLRVVADSAAFVPGYLALGASPDAGSSYFLSRSIGAARALSVLILNRPLRAPELLRLGLADEVAADGDALCVAHRLAKEVSRTSPEALVAARRLVDLAPTQGLTTHLDAEAAEFAALWKSDLFRARVTAFVDGSPSRAR
jgi:2-(1,2-epoxy-1,2-dihydrophenyl)acetyl-CoA isomerase